MQYLVGGLQRQKFLDGLQKPFMNAMGDGRRPINEVTLWSWGASAAAFWKSAAARFVLERQISETELRWRTLRIAIDGLAFYGLAARLPDLLARRDLLRDVLDQVQTLLEETYPLGNGVYRDETGSAFLVPHLQGDDEHGARLLSLVETEIRQVFDRSSIGGEVIPCITVSPADAHGLTLAGELTRPTPAPQADPQQVARWWQGQAAEVCPVCGVRPQGPSQKARERKVCDVCERRRADRAKEWTRALSATIWTDEVADKNGRLALVVGRFDLGHWLDGAMVRTLAVIDPAQVSARTADQIAKNPSFARLRRVWETTRAFWRETQDGLSSAVGTVGGRLAIYPRETNSLDLGRFHTYELVVNGVRLSVVWDSDKKRFITCDNPDYLAKPEQLGRPVAEVVQPGRTFLLEEPAGYGGANRRLGQVLIAQVKTLDDRYTPAIPILAEPRTFMALVPADKALDVVRAIKTRYEREMGKVRNRLPLHLGVVYAGRRTPLRAVLDAGRRMLAQPPLGAVDAWQVQQDVVRQTGPLPAAVCNLADGTQQFQTWYAVSLKNEALDRTLTWYVPAVMGDGATEDCWYPYVFLKAGGEPTDRNRRFQAPNPWTGQMGWLVHAGDLKKGDTVYFTPASLDFEYLDTAGRRFEIAYNEAGQRRGRPTRPYLLDELATLDAAWEAIAGAKGLTNSQIHALRDLIETKRQEWRPTPTDCAGASGMFWRFCRDAILTAQWPKDGRPGGDALRNLTDWAASGLLNDVIELRMGIMKESSQRTPNQEETNQ